MNRTPDQSRDGVDVRRRSATDEEVPRVDETQSARQETTAAAPRLDRLGAEEDDLSAAELDDAWARLSAALIAADEEFDAAAAYERLSQSLPRDLVTLPLVERVTVRRAADARLERRNFAWGLAAMLTVCAGLGGLAFFGPEWEGRRERAAELASVDAKQVDPQKLEPPQLEASQTERPDAASLSPSETWEDRAWDERFTELLNEFDAERRRMAVSRRVDQETEFDVRRLEHDFARVRHDFERQPGF